MKGVLSYAFVTLYALAAMWWLIQLWEYIVEPMGTAVHIVIYAGWLCICFSACRWWPQLMLSGKLLRETRLEEDEWLHPILHELDLRTRLEPCPELLVLEDPALISYVSASNNIVLSTGLLVHLSPLEIKAVLAHEYGQLKHRDTVSDTAIEMAAWVPCRIYSIVHTVFIFLFKHCWKGKERRFKILICGLFALLCFRNFDTAFLLVILFIFMKLFPLYQNGANRIWCFFRRDFFSEQYYFTEVLGYGKQLESAILKIETMHSPGISHRFERIGRVSNRNMLS